MQSTLIHTELVVATRKPQLSTVGAPGSPGQHALLESLFVFQGTRKAIERLQQQLSREIRRGEDDVLLYPLRADQQLHRWGSACLLEGLYDFSLPSLVEHRESRIWTPKG
jgi:hypothetical protein